MIRKSIGPHKHNFFGGEAGEELCCQLVVTLKQSRRWQKWLTVFAFYCDSKSPHLHRPFSPLRLFLFTKRRLFVSRHFGQKCPLKDLYLWKAITKEQPLQAVSFTPSGLTALLLFRGVRIIEFELWEKEGFTLLNLSCECFRLTSLSSSGVWIVK